jgi:hypothetical protein
MAKSLYTTLEEGTFEVKHQHEYVTLELPQWIKRAGAHLDSEDDLIVWAEGHEVMHGLLHMGLQQAIIALRAAARPAVNAKTGETKSIIDDREKAQKRVDEYVVKPIKKPGTSKKETTPEDALAVLRKAGYSLDQIKAALGQ